MSSTPIQPTRQLDFATEAVALGQAQGLKRATWHGSVFTWITSTLKNLFGGVFSSAKSANTIFETYQRDGKLNPVHLTHVSKSTLDKLSAVFVQKDATVTTVILERASVSLQSAFCIARSEKTRIWIATLGQQILNTIEARKPAPRQPSPPPALPPSQPSQPPVETPAGDLSPAGRVDDDHVSGDEEEERTTSDGTSRSTPRRIVDSLKQHARVESQDAKIDRYQRKAREAAERIGELKSTIAEEKKSENRTTLKRALLEAKKAKDSAEEALEEAKLPITEAEAAKKAADAAKKAEGGRSAPPDVREAVTTANRALKDARTVHKEVISIAEKALQERHQDLRRAEKAYNSSTYKTLKAELRGVETYKLRRDEKLEQLTSDEHDEESSRPSSLRESMSKVVRRAGSALKGALASPFRSRPSDEAARATGADAAGEGGDDMFAAFDDV